MVSGGEPIRRRRRIRWFVAVVCIGIVAAVADGLTYSPVFRTRSIQVIGDSVLGERRVLRLAGIRVGDNVFHLDTTDAERRLETDPRIARAWITRRLPSTVRITVVERTPVAVVAGAAGTSVLVAGDGTTLGPATGAGGLPLLVLPDGVRPDATSLRGAAVASAAMPAAFRSQVETILTLPDGSLRLAMRSGVSVSYGPPNDLAAKARSAQALLRWAADQGKALASIDVSVSGAPTATPIGASVPAI